MEERKAKKNKKYQPEHFDPEKILDVSRYFSEYLPKKIAQNYAKLHNLGLAHVFPHPGNVSLVGAICDTDSVKGVATGLNDAPVTAGDVINDLDMFLGVVDIVQVLETKFFHKYMPGLAKAFRDTFRREYLSKREVTGDTVENIAIRAPLYGGFMDPEDRDLLNSYVSVLTEKLGFDFTEDPLSQDYIETFFDEQREHLTRMLSFILKIAEEQDNETMTATMRHAASAGLSIPLSDQFKTFIRGRLSIAVWNALEPTTSNIVEVHGTETAEVITAMFATREYHKIAENMPQDALTARFNAFKQEYIRDKGWEEDVVVHIGQIDKLFDDNQSAIRDYYLSLMAGQLGWDYHFDEPVDSIVQGFNPQFDEDADEGIIGMALDGLRTECGEKVSLEFVQDMVGVDAFGQEDLSEYLKDSVSKRIKNRFKQQTAEKLVNLTEKYGEKTASLVCDLICDRETDQMLSLLTPEHWNIIIERERAYLSSLAQEAFTIYESERTSELVARS